MGNCIITRRGGGTDISGLDATPANVLTGKKFVGSTGEQQIGTMANVASTELAKSAVAANDNIYFRMTNGAHITNTSSGYPEVYYPKKNFGDAAANHVISGKTFTSAAGFKVKGTIPSKAAATYTPKATEQKIAGGQYLAGDQTIAAAKLLDSSGSIADTHAAPTDAYENFTLQVNLNCKINIVLAVASASNSLTGSDIKLQAKIGSSTVTLNGTNGTYISYKIGPASTCVYLWINDKTYAESTFTNVTFDVGGGRYCPGGNLRVWKS